MESLTCYSVEQNFFAQGLKGWVCRKDGKPFPEKWMLDSFPAGG